MLIRPIAFIAFELRVELQIGQFNCSRANVLSASELLTPQQLMAFVESRNPKRRND